MSKGPNKIVLLPADLMFVMPKGSIFTSKVCLHLCFSPFRLFFSWKKKVNLRNEPHERSNVSIRSEEIQAGKTARYNVSTRCVFFGHENAWIARLGWSGGSEEITCWSIISANESDARITIVERSSSWKCQYIHWTFHRSQCASFNLRIWSSRKFGGKLKIIAFH